ncbi:hypothetical protein EQV77_09780 [Halobacillus fulvus]|nr:hypothetical protein EQV77_09780 [Halobacillus fulvus]
MERMKAGLIINASTIDHHQKEMIRKIVDHPAVQVEVLVDIGRREQNEWPVPTVKGTLNAWEGLDPHTLSELRKHSLDWILSLTKVRLQGDVLDLPVHGVWVFRHQLDQEPFLRDFYNKAHVSHISLDRLYHRHEAASLKTATIALKLNSYSNHLSKVAHMTMDWPLMVSEGIRKSLLHTGRPVSIFRPAPLTWREKLKVRQTMLLNKVKWWRDALFSYEYWNVGISRQTFEQLTDGEPLKVDWMDQRKDVFYADPFMYRDGDSWKIIMEEVDHRVVKGFISEWTLDENGKVKEDKGTIQLPVHLSYPYMIQYEGDFYCIPESSAAKEAVLYKWMDGWQPVKTLIAGFAAIDSTIIQHENRWWLFCTRATSYRGDNEELHVFYADELMGEWTPHPLNPVKIDVRSSRPAGTPFYNKGELYRPAQDCSKTYGGRIAINRVQTLTVDDFEEETVKIIDPVQDSDYSSGVHTISFVNDQAVVDGKRTEYRFRHLFKKYYLYRPLPFERINQKPSARSDYLMGKRKRKTLDKTTV